MWLRRNMTKTDYNKVRFNLTNAMRFLEQLKIYLEIHRKLGHFMSEIDYWISTLELIRNCLYGCTDVYPGRMDIKGCIAEVKDELDNCVAIKRNITSKEMYYLGQAWKYCKDAEKSIV